MRLSIYLIDRPQGNIMTKLSLDKDKIKILLLEGLHQSAVDTFTQAGYNNIQNIKTALSEEELIEKIKDAHFVGIRSRTNLNASVLAAAD
jgi:D-3-phosphoglycerate dehydrogenase